MDQNWTGVISQGVGGSNQKALCVCMGGGGGQGIGYYLEQHICNLLK